MWHPAYTPACGIRFGIRVKGTRASGEQIRFNFISARDEGGVQSQLFKRGIANWAHDTPIVRNVEREAVPPCHCHEVCNIAGVEGRERQVPLPIV